MPAKRKRMRHFLKMGLGLQCSVQQTDSCTSPYRIPREIQETVKLHQRIVNGTQCRPAGHMCENLARIDMPTAHRARKISSALVPTHIHRCHIYSRAFSQQAFLKSGPPENLSRKFSSTAFSV